jgi:hypothetical protein
LLHLGLQLLQALRKGQQQLAAEHEWHGVGEDCRGRRRAGREAGQSQSARRGDSRAAASPGNTQ